MGIFGKFFNRSTTSYPEEIITFEQNESFIVGAERAAGIVTQGLESGDISSVSSKLNDLYLESDSREKYVFDPPKNLYWYIAVVIWTLFSIVFLYILYIEAGTALLSEAFRSDALYMLIISGIIVVLNVVVIKSAFDEVLFSKRYQRYQTILRYKQIELVDDMTLVINKKASIVENDLKKAVRLKLIPQGHFSRNKMAFMVSDRAYRKYKENRAEYDRYFKNFTEERNRMKSRTKETEDLLSQGHEYVQKIRDCNNIIKDKEISEKLNRMEKIVAAIFHEVDINPAQSNKLGVFMGYYLPTTEKLLETYINMDEKRVNSMTIKKAQKDISYALDSINDAFDCLLERFFEEQEIDIASDISAMETIMTQEGLVNNGIE